MEGIIKRGQNLSIQLKDGKEIDFGKVRKDMMKASSVPAVIKYGENYPTIIELKKQIGEEKITTIIEILLLDLVEFFGLKDGMKPDQIKSTAELIVTTYNFKNLCINEVIFIFNEAKKGNYGDVFVLNGQRILKWFSDYFDKRCEYFESKNSVNNFRDDFERKSTKDAEEMKKIILNDLKNKKHGKQ